MNPYIFSYDRYELDDRELKFFYSYQKNGQEIGAFCENYKLPISVDVKDPLTKYILQILHLIVGVSYYKSLLGEVHTSYKLNKDEAAYLNDVFDNGFGELAYLNKITDSIRPFTANSDHSASPKDLHGDGAILGIGGGKDSIVAGELLKKLRVSTATMDMATRDNRGQAGAVMDIMGFDQLTIERYVDTKIVSFTDEHRGNHGHIPFSALLAWFGVLLAYATNKRYIMMANESATSTGNTTWNGRVVNHQWTKSYEFETITQNFIHTTIASDIWYFSPIRPYSSLAVIALFVSWGEKYYETLTSCNFVLRIDPDKRPNNRWCGVCPKCLSTWLLLSSWLDVKQLEKMFSKNLFDDTSLKPLLMELLDLEGHKPLNCVGTSEELRAVTRKALQEHTNAPLLDGLSESVIPGPSIETLMHDIAEHNIPEELEQPILQCVAEQLE